MPNMPPVPFHVIAQDFAQLLKSHDVQDLQAQIAAQLSQFTGQAMLLTISYQELESRGFPISKPTKALLQTLQMLAMGDGKLGITLPAQSLHLPTLMEEVMPAATALAIVQQANVPDQVKHQVEQELPAANNFKDPNINPAPTTSTPVTHFDFKNRKRLH